MSSANLAVRTTLGSTARPSSTMTGGEDLQKRSVTSEDEASVASSARWPVYDILGEYRKAIEYHERGLKISWRPVTGKAGQEHREPRRCVPDRGVPQGHRHHERALAISVEIGDRQGQGSCLGSLGIAYDSMGEYRKAIEYHERAAKISRWRPAGRGQAPRQPRRYVQRHGGYREAIDYRVRALAIRGVGDRRGQGSVLGKLGNAYNNVSATGPSSTMSGALAI